MRARHHRTASTRRPPTRCIAWWALHGAGLVAFAGCLQGGFEPPPGWSAGPEVCDEDGVCEEGEEPAGCPLDCAECGNGSVEVGEACDGGDADTESCDRDCTIPECGDGIYNEAAEDCDDGNDVDADLCSNACIRARHVFVTRDPYPVDAIANAAGADALCQATAEAEEFGAPGARWVAWFSDDASAPVDRMDTSFAGWYVLPALPALIPLAKGWDDLTDGSLMVSISIAEDTKFVMQNVAVWTNTRIDGTPQGTDCAGWTSTSALESAAAGNASATDGAWTEGGTFACDTALRLYCFEQGPS